MTQKQLRQRLEDLFTGANNGYPYNPESCVSILSELGPDRFGGFLNAIHNTFALTTDNLKTPYALQRHHFDKFTDMNTLAAHLWDYLEQNQ